MRKLGKKESLFVDEYLVDLNATQAVVRAGYRCKRPEQQGYELLRKPDIATAIQERMDQRSRVTQITATKVLLDIERVRGKAEEACKFGDALKASELQGKHLKMFIDRVEASGSVTIHVNTGVPRGPGD